MDNLPQIIANQDGSKAINARDLHTFIESKQDFSDWIKLRIKQYGFKEKEDYHKIMVADYQTVGNEKAPIEYIITLDMGKELAMVERNAKGRQIRKYFIEVEKKAKQVYGTTQSLPQNFQGTITVEMLENIIFLDKVHDRKAMLESTIKMCNFLSRQNSVQIIN